MESHTTKKTFIVIPAYNEGTVIASVIRDVQKEGWKDIIVADDGSTDSTYDEAKKTGVIVLRHSLNRGKGAAVKTGFEAAKKLHADCIVTIGADGQHDPKDIKRLFELLHKGNDVVLGVRNFDEKHIPRLKVVGNYIGNFFTWMLYGVWVTDSQSGIRAYNRKALNSITIYNDRYEFETEIVREISRNNLTWKEIPISVRYTDYDQNKKNKQSLISAIKTMLRLVMFD
jgi:glycosyltransferase involved in cell wall biosynthesis